MRRRDFVTICGLALLGGAAALWRNLPSFWQPRFDGHAARTVSAVTDLMFPGDRQGIHTPRCGRGWSSVARDQSFSLPSLRASAITAN